MTGQKKCKEHILYSIANNIFELILLPTEMCNFRCTYCYEDFKIGKMPNSVVTGVKNLLKQRIDELDRLNIEWFGGEPLANLKTVLDITHYAKTLSQSSACQFSSGMTTNGYLLKPETFQKLLTAGVTFYQISLDGPEKVHNKTRLRTDGAGTFSRIWKNLELMTSVKDDFSIILRVHITPENADFIPELIEKINHTFSGDNRFNIFLKAISDLGGPNSGKISTLREKNHHDIMHNLSKLINIKQKNLPGKDDAPYVCYASKTNSLVVRANGRIAKCTVAFSDDRNDIGYINEDGTLTLNQKKLQPWVRGLISQNAKDLYCPLKEMPSSDAQEEVNRIPSIAI